MRQCIPPAPRGENPSFPPEMMIQRRDVCAFALGFVACFVLHLINFEGRGIAVLGSPPIEVCDDGHDEAAEGSAAGSRPRDSDEAEIPSQEKTAAAVSWSAESDPGEYVDFPSRYAARLTTAYFARERHV